MEKFELKSAVRGYHIYKDIWKPTTSDKLFIAREFGNQLDKFAIKVLSGSETVGYLPHEYSKIMWYPSPMEDQFPLKWQDFNDTANNFVVGWRFLAW